MNGIRDIAQRMTRLEDLTILKTTNRQSSGPIVSGVHRSIPKMSPKIEAEITDAIRDRITKNSITDISTILNDTRFMSYLKDLFRLGFPSTTKISSRFYEAIIANIIEEVMKDFAPSFL